MQGQDERAPRLVTPELVDGSALLPPPWDASLCSLATRQQARDADKGLDAQLTHLQLRGDGGPGGAIAAASAVPAARRPADGGRRGAGRRPAGPAALRRGASGTRASCTTWRTNGAGATAGAAAEPGRGAQSGSLSSPWPWSGSRPALAAFSWWPGSRYLAPPGPRRRKL